MNKPVTIEGKTHAICPYLDRDGGCACEPETYTPCDYANCVFKCNPDMDATPSESEVRKCPKCGTKNTPHSERCSYCAALIKDTGE